MAIIRSKIARQLLAEGGAPRKGFFEGGYGDETEGFDFGQEAPASSPSSSTGFEGSPEMGGRGTADTYGFDQSGPAGDSDDNFIIQTLKNLGTNVGDKVRAFDKFINPNRDPFNRAARRAYLIDQGIIRPGPLGDEDLTVQGFTGDLASKAGLDFARSKGYKTIDDMIKTEGGDNELIKKLRAPITEKKEEPKDEFADILKFYGARFARGGSTGFEGSPEMGGRGTEETYGFDQSGPAGDSGDDGGPPMIQPDTGPRGSGPLGMPTFQNLQTHFANNAKLEEAVRMGLITNEEYNVLGGYDARQTMGLGPVDTFITSGLYNVAQSLGKGRGNQPFSEIPGDVMRNVRGASTRGISPELQGKYNQIIGPKMKDGGDVRQEYGLGSIVKKATRAVKKVVKSPIGKAALLGGLAYFGPSFLAGTKFGFAGTQGPLALQRSMKAARLGRAFGEFTGGLNPLTTILGTSLLAGGLSKEDEEDEKLPTVANTDPEMTKFLEFYGGPRRFAAEGGMMEQDEMLDLGGKEMDLRGGGFVPLGEYEKKDDVPARLSKNEFVFTADAVRAAGGGSVDKGADVMYKTMKTLENKVA